DFAPRVDRAGSSSSSDDAAIGADKESCLPSASAPAEAESFEDPYRLRATLWRMCGETCADQSCASCRRGGPLPAQPTRRPCPTSVLPHHDDLRYLETDRPAVFAKASTGVGLRAVSH